MFIYLYVEKFIRWRRRLGREFLFVVVYGYCMLRIVDVIDKFESVKNG